MEVLTNSKPILSGIALPGRCRCCKKTIYPGNSYFVHADASANDSDRVYVVCSDCEKSEQSSRNQQPGPVKNGKESGRTMTGTGTSAKGANSSGTSDGRKVNEMTDKQWVLHGQIAALLNGTGYQMKLGKNGYMFFDANGKLKMDYFCVNPETALENARKIKEKEGANHG